MQVSCDGTMTHVDGDIYKCDDCGRMRTVPDRHPSRCGAERLATTAELAHRERFMDGPDQAYWWPMLATMPRRGIALESYVGGGAGAFLAFGYSRGTCLGIIARWDGPNALTRAEEWLDRVYGSRVVPEIQRY